ncbi:MAG: proton-conducting transporter membrane subunit [Desulfurococcaceae archaeon]
MEIERLALNALGSLTPLLALTAFMVPLLSKLTKNNRVVPFIAALTGSSYAAFASSVVLYYVLTSKKPLVYMYGGWPPHFGIVYEVDSFNAVIGALTAWVMIPIVLYSHWYSRHLDDTSWYYTLLIGLEVGILGCLYTGDAFNLFVMIEVLGLSAYGLVAYHRDKAEAVEAAAKYALIGAVATTMYFMAVVLLYAGFGTVNMALLSSLSRTRVLAELRYISLMAIALSLWVFTYKAAVFPNHFWLPDAHPEAPTPVSAALSGLVVNVGVYATARFLYTLFSANSIAAGYREAVLLALFVLGASSGLLGALMMMLQRDIKRLLAYSTISHMGVAFMGIAIGFLADFSEAVKVAVMGALVHIVSHGIAKALLFMASGIFIDASGSRDLDAMRGVGRYYPITSISMIIGFMSLAGLIPLAGFYSKLLISLGYLNAGFVLGPVLIIAISALSVPGYMKVVSSVVFGVGEHRERVEKCIWVELVLLGMAISLVVMGVVFSWLAPVFEEASISLVENVDTYVSAVHEKIPKNFEGWLP